MFPPMWSKYKYKQYWLVLHALVCISVFAPEWFSNLSISAITHPPVQQRSSRGPARGAEPELQEHRDKRS